MKIAILNSRLLLLVIIVPIFNTLEAQVNERGKIVYSPIGIFHTSYTQQTGAPRQGILEPEGRATIEIYPEFRKALQSLNLFKHIIVIYHLDKVNGWEDTALPPGADKSITYGLFATRTPRRPNPIGIATVKLEKIEEGVLYVSGVDAFNGTPILDIKPYLPSIDCVQSDNNKKAESSLGLNK